MDKVNLLIKMVAKELEIYHNYVSESLVSCMEKLVEVMEESSQEEKYKIISEIRKVADSEKVLSWIYLQSIILRFMPDAGEVTVLINYVKENRGLTVYNRYFLYGQINSLIFKNPQLDTLENAVAREELLMRVCEEMEDSIQMDLQEIPAEKRNKKLVLVITAQFVSEEHGPSKTALDRCGILIKNMGKTVLLINTAELLTTVGAIPYYKIQEGVYKPDYLSCEKQVWRGLEIPYYQCEQIMPDIHEYQELLTKIRSLKPYCIVSIGGSSLLANMCRNMVPTLTISCFPSALEPSLMRYQTLGRKISDYDREFVKQRNKPEDYIVECIFTSGLKEQTQKFERHLCGIPEQAFVITVVGGRLSEEVTDEFLETMEKCIQQNTYVLFAGVFYKYKEKLHRHPILESRSAFVGVQEDILAYFELCDLYVNPHRRGGGTSSVEAMSKGIPVVTTDFGDVSVNAGTEFCVADYKEMIDKIIRYQTDEDYYRMMSEKARERADILLNSEAEFVQIMQEMGRRENMRV